MNAKIFGLVALYILPSATFAGIKTDIPYGKHPRQVLDLYLPAKSATNAPVMLYVHGGGWKMGDKKRTHDKDDYFNASGWIFASTNYRLFPEGKHPANVEDIANAIAWLNDHIAEFGGNPDSIFIMGHSAGAHLVSLVATDPRHLGKFKKDLSIIKGVIALDTQAYDIPELLKDSGSDVYREVFGDDPAVWRDASPIHHIQENVGIPPFLIAYSTGMGMARNPARAKQADNFSSALGVFGIHAEVIDASDRNHMEINQWFGRKPDDRVTQKAGVFLETMLQPDSE